MGEQTDDRELVEKIVSGERELVTELVGRYEKRILNYVYRIIHRYEDAHDLTQEIFIKVFMALDRYDPKYQFSTWIFRIAQNSAIDTLRKRSLPEVSLTKSGPNDEEGKEREIADDGISPYRNLKNKELSVAIDEAIEGLPIDYRELIQLRHFGELSYEEIADLKEMPLGTVTNKLVRARNMLKDTLSHFLEPI